MLDLQGLGGNIPTRLAGFLSSWGTARAWRGKAVSSARKEKMGSLLSKVPRTPGKTMPGCFLLI